VNFAIIPCRMDSERFWGKPRAEINDKAMLRHVYDAVVEHKYIDGVAIAFDIKDLLIESECCVNFIPAVATGNHPTGSDRVFEASQKLGINRGIIVNVQGDEPLIQHTHISSLLSLFDDPQVRVGTIAYRATDEQAQSKDCVKVIFDGTMKVFKFARTVEPGQYYINVGIYAYRLGALSEFARTGPTENEKALNVEAQRFLDIGIPVHVAITDVPTIGVDRPEDIAKVEAALKRRGNDRP